jgi:oxalate decarboxylase/phosphoglucose isomerase-like protein (cupin superfamily)
MEIINRDKVKAFITRDGSEIRETLAPRNSSLRNQSLAEARVSRGKATRQHYNSESEEIYSILQGKAQTRVEGEVRATTGGDGIAIMTGQIHRIWNTGAKELVFLCRCSPSCADEYTVLTE